MNDQVTALYEQMFAPDPIPGKVKVLFDRVNFLLSRIDAPGMKPRDLAIIAACANVVTNDQLDDVDAMPVEVRDTIDTTEKPTPAPGPEPEPAHVGPTGPMDAPAKPTSRRPNITAAKLEEMTMRELRTHAKEFYGWSVPSQYKKPQVIAVLLEKQKAE